MENLREFFEAEEYNTVYFYEDCMEVETYTPAGEDWIFTVPFLGSMKELSEFLYDMYWNFDVDEEASMWIAHRGENGVPSSVRVLIEDQEWKEAELKRLYVKALDASNSSDHECDDEWLKKGESMVKRALEQGVAKLISNPNDGCISCQIGDKYYWFYFMDDPEYENMRPEEILERFSLDELATLIENAINGLDPDEVMYYDSIMDNLL